MDLSTRRNIEQTPSKEYVYPLLPGPEKFLAIASKKEGGNINNIGSWNSASK
jgi:hypothetical protein